MNCPVCKNELKTMKVGDITVDACESGCGGIWFDRFELQKVDEPDEYPGEQLLDLKTDPDIKVDQAERRTCPHCGDVILMRHFCSVQMAVAVDECPKCAGIWLDTGELKKIRSQYRSVEEREWAAENYFSRLFDEGLAAMHAEGVDEYEKYKRLAHVLRFICPSYYIPGKQKWGAF